MNLLVYGCSLYYPYKLSICLEVFINEDKGENVQNICTFVTKLFVIDQNTLFGMPHRALQTLLLGYIFN